MRKKATGETEVENTHRTSSRFSNQFSYTSDKVLMQKLYFSTLLTATNVTITVQQWQQHHQQQQQRLQQP